MCQRSLPASVISRPGTREQRDTGQGNMTLDEAINPSDPLSQHIRNEMIEIGRLTLPNMAQI